MKIFISHSSKNKSYGNLIVELLRNLGIKEDEVIFTSNVAYGIPVGKNIFHWLKFQIEEKPFVIYLLSEQYYDSVACLNEMGAAWIVESDHAAIFTPDFKLSSEKFQSGALDPREIGFYINDEERVYSFIQVLSESFNISNNTLLISQNVKKFITEINRIVPEEVSKNLLTKKVEVKEAETTIKKEDTNVQKVRVKPAQFEKGNLYSKFLGFIEADNLKQDELLLLHYIIDTGKIKLMTGWQQEQGISNIIEWEKINDIKDVLSKNYSSVLNRFELRGFTEISAVTSYNNPKEVKLKEEIASKVLDLPSYVLTKIDEAVQSNFFKHEEKEKIEEDDDLPF